MMPWSSHGKKLTATASRKGELKIFVQLIYSVKKVCEFHWEILPAMLPVSSKISTDKSR